MAQIDPESLEEYVFNGGYDAAREAYLEMTQEKIIEEVGKSVRCEVME